MSRFWIGVTLLGVFLFLGLWVAWAMNDIHEPICQSLEQAADAALAGDLETGAALASDAKNTWDRHWRGTASAADHAPMDDIDSLFAQVQIYAQAGKTADFAAGCGRLAKLIAAIGEAHSPGWWNLL